MNYFHNSLILATLLFLIAGCNHETTTVGSALIPGPQDTADLTIGSIIFHVSDAGPIQPITKHSFVIAGKGKSHSSLKTGAVIIDADYADDVCEILVGKHKIVIRDGGGRVELDGNPIGSINEKQKVSIALFYNKREDTAESKPKVNEPVKPPTANQANQGQAP